MRRRVLSGVIAGLAALSLVGCSATSTIEPSTAPLPAVSVSPPPSPTPTADAGFVTPVGKPKVLATGLHSPWSIVRLATGSALISERDSGTVLEYTTSGKIRTVGTVSGVAHAGEGGLLGLAVLDAGATTYLYAYYTSARDNRIVRMPLVGSAGSYTLGSQEAILTGLAKAANHNGGRIAIGPDDKLYATVGDAGQPSRAQDKNSLNGKILRMNLNGSVPADNPFPDSRIYSMGHRNPQGLAWDATGQLWASEFGQNTWDEFNRIVPGKNYGWPTVEGIGKKAGFVDPVLHWKTSDASPSGLAFVHNTFFMVSLRGQRLWAIYPESKAHATAWFVGEYGRLRDAIPGPDGTLWMLTNNTDGRGSPRAGDDKLIEVTLEPLKEG